MPVHGTIALCLLVCHSVYHSICMLINSIQCCALILAGLGGARPSSSRGKLSWRHQAVCLFACLVSAWLLHHGFLLARRPVHPLMLLALTNALISVLIAGRPRHNLYYPTINHARCAEHGARLDWFSSLAPYSLVRTLC